MTESRIPEYTNNSFDGMLTWFAEMSVRELLFHPDDRPEDIITIATNEPAFTDIECQKLNTILGSMFEQFEDMVYEAAYPIFMKTMGLRMDA
jgi:hypothetical protein